MLSSAPPHSRSHLHNRVAPQQQQHKQQKQKPRLHLTYLPDDILDLIARHVGCMGADAYTSDFTAPPTRVDYDSLGAMGRTCHALFSVATAAIADHVVLHSSVVHDDRIMSQHMALGADGRLAHRPRQIHLPDPSASDQHLTTLRRTMPSQAALLAFLAGTAAQRQHSRESSLTTSAKVPTILIHPPSPPPPPPPLLPLPIPSRHVRHLGLVGGMHGDPLPLVTSLLVAASASLVRLHVSLAIPPPTLAALLTAALATCPRLCKLHVTFPCPEDMAALATVDLARLTTVGLTWGTVCPSRHPTAGAMCVMAQLPPSLLGGRCQRLILRAPRIAQAVVRAALAMSCIVDVEIQSASNLDVWDRFDSPMVASDTLQSLTLSGPWAVNVLSRLTARGLWRLNAATLSHPRSLMDVDCSTLNARLPKLAAMSLRGCGLAEIHLLGKLPRLSRLVLERPCRLAGGGGADTRFVLPTLQSLVVPADIGVQLALVACMPALAMLRLTEGGFVGQPASATHLNGSAHQHLDHHQLPSAHLPALTFLSVDGHRIRELASDRLLSQLTALQLSCPPKDDTIWPHLTSLTRLHILGSKSLVHHHHRGMATTARTTVRGGDSGPSSDASLLLIDHALPNLERLTLGDPMPTTSIAPLLVHASTLLALTRIPTLRHVSVCGDVLMVQSCPKQVSDGAKRGSSVVLNAHDRVEPGVWAGLAKLVPRTSDIRSVDVCVDEGDQDGVLTAATLEQVQRLHSAWCAKGLPASVPWRAVRGSEEDGGKVVPISTVPTETKKVVSSSRRMSPPIAVAAAEHVRGPRHAGL
ncbi:hypothetical protein BC828DRAFT_374721 [Blastocladiella britannica]|nr:hypothetical protein BC828DRAFT_374721 [Blastocladiella britannica]